MTARSHILGFLQPDGEDGEIVICPACMARSRYRGIRMLRRCIWFKNMGQGIPCGDVIKIPTIELAAEILGEKRRNDRYNIR